MNNKNYTKYSTKELFFILNQIINTGSGELMSVPVENENLHNLIRLIIYLNYDNENDNEMMRDYLHLWLKKIHDPESKCNIERYDEYDNRKEKTNLKLQEFSKDKIISLLIESIENQDCKICEYNGNNKCSLLNCHNGILNFLENNTIKNDRGK